MNVAVNEDSSGDVLSIDDRPMPRLVALCFLLEDVQRVRIAAHNRGFNDQADSLKLEEDRISRLIKKEFADHPMYDWLPNGLRGPKVAMLLSIMETPHRFPNKSCLQAYFGLSVRNGRLPKRAKGVKANWNNRGRVSLIGPKGVADQIILHRVQPYRDIYDAEKERLLNGGDDRGDGDEKTVEAPMTQDADERSPGDGGKHESIRPIQAHKIARTIAVKAFLRDLWKEWKER